MRLDETHEYFREVWANTTPFEVPTVACRNCGKVEEHNFCFMPAWFDRLLGKLGIR